MSTSLQYKIFSPFIKSIPFLWRIKLLYFRRFGYFPDLVNPKNFNEKVQFYKVHNRDSLLTVCADKVESKKFIKDVVSDVYVPETIWVGSSESELDFLSQDILPKDFVFKANHLSKAVYFKRAGDSVNIKMLKNLAGKWLAMDQSAVLCEWAYQDIKRKVFIEEFLDYNGTVPDDYKFFVFHGKVKFIQVDSSRFNDHKRNMMDADWNDLGFDYSHPRKNKLERPYYLEEMIRISELIGSYFDFVRVDLYFYKGRVTFGELTFYPGAGFEKFPKPEYDLLFGKYWNVEKSKVKA